MKTKYLFLVILLLLTSCTQSETTNEPFTYEITKEEMLADYDNFWETLEENYPYFESLKSKGVNVSYLKEIYREKIETDAQNIDDFHNLLSYLIYSDLLSEGHLMFLNSYDYNIQKEIIKEHYDNPSQDDIIYKYLDYIYFDENVDKRYNLENLDNYIEDAKEPSLEINRYNTFDTLVINYKSFDIDREEIISNVNLINDELKSANYDKVIIDLRDNIGGYIQGWNELVSILIDEDINIEENYLVKGKIGEENLDYRFENNEDESINLIQKSNINSNKLYKVSQTIDSKKEIDYNPEIYILLGRNSYSASIRFANFAQKYNFAKVISDDHIYGGDGGASRAAFNRINHVLPNSHFVITFYTAITTDENGNPNSTVLEPDINIRGTRDYLDLIKRINSLERDN